MWGRLLAALIVLCAACGTDASGTSATPDSALQVGAHAPEFSTTLLNGTILSLKALRGKVVLLNFWATWCGPCRSEMPFFQKLADGYSAKDFTVLAINDLESADKIAPFTQQYGLKFTVGLDTQGAINRLYGVQQYPTSYVIGRDGAILARQFGPFPADALVEALKKWIAS